LNSNTVKRYFKQSAVDFNGIYDNKGSLLDKLINKVFRKGMYERVPLTMQWCGDVQGKSVLDIACGSGRVSLLLAERGARVIGIDYSSEMIELAKKYLSEYKTSVNVEFICGDFVEDFNIKELFDITLALGVFDYLKEPLPCLQKMKDSTKEVMIASYPAKFALQVPVRRLWLLTKGCPVYFYTEKKLAQMYSSVRVKNYELMQMPLSAKIPTDYLVKA